MSGGDHDLLRQYARGGSQAAFAELVRRHVNLVYSSAYRQVRSSALAEEIAQSVFIDLARNASRIESTTPLVAWLHLVTRRTAIDTIRRESRRQVREQTAAEIAAMKSPPSDWSGIEPLLDEAIESLSETDRAAILFRFFENKSLREIGASFGTSDDAAQKRVTRAVELLRAFFVRRGVAATATGLTANLSAHTLQIAPVGLSASICTAVGLSGAAGLVVEATKAISMTTLQKSILAAILTLGFGGAAFEISKLRAKRAEFTALHQRSDQIAAEIRRTSEQRDLALRGFLDAQQRFAARLPARTSSDVALETEMAAWLERTARLKRMRDQRPDLVTHEVRMLSDDSLFAAARELNLETEEQVRTTFAQLRSSSEDAIVNKIQKALHRYLDSHDGTLPQSSRELAAFFDPPIDPAALHRYVLKQHGRIADLPANAILIAQTSPLDFSRDFVYEIGLNSRSSRRALADHVRKAVLAFIDANNGVKPTLPEHLQPYLPVPVDPATLQPYLNPPRR